MAFQHPQIGGSGRVKSDLLLHRPPHLRHLRLVPAGDDEHGGGHLHIVQGAALGPGPPLHGGQGHLPQITGRVEGMHVIAVAHLPGQLRHQRPHPGDVNGDVRMLDRARVEKRGHQRERIENPFETEALPGLPGVPDGPQGRNVFGQTQGGRTPRHGKTPLNVRFDLGAQTEQETPAGQGGQIPRGLGHHHRGAGEGHRDGRSVIQVGGRGRGNRHREKRVVAGVGGEKPVATDALRPRRLLGNPPQLDVRQVVIELHLSLLVVRCVGGRPNKAAHRPIIKRTRV